MTSDARDWNHHMVFLLLLAFPLSGFRLGNSRDMRVLLSASLMINLLQASFLGTGKKLAQFGPVTVSSVGVERGIHLASHFVLLCPDEWTSHWIPMIRVE